MKWAFMVALMTTVVGCASLRDYPDPHHHKVSVHSGKNSRFHVQAMDIKTARDVEFRRDATSKDVWNPAKTKWAGFAVRSVADSKGKGCDSPVIVLGGRDETAACVFTDEWPYRPLADLKWLTDRLLVFDLWTGPSYGWHYVVDAERRKVVFVSGFWDEYGE